ncbi:MAG TPA: DUF1697 domain-containing protein [Sphingomicrobium sp.]
MTAYVAMVRGVMPVGSGKLPDATLKAMGEDCGFENARPFIASGNLLFSSKLGEKEVHGRLVRKIDDYFGRHVPIFVRSAEEMADVVKRNPFPDDKPSRVMAHFIDEKPVQVMLDEARDVQGERLALGPRLIYVSYGEGIGKTKLKLPAVKQGTARNMNSVAKMAELLAGME